MLLQKIAKTKPRLHRVAAALLEVNPCVATYELQSDSMIELPEQMHDKFRCELGDIEKEEANGNYACDLATLHLGNSLSHRQPDRADAVAVRAEKAAASAECKCQLAVRRIGLAQDQKELANTEATLAANTAALENKQKIRMEGLMPSDKQSKLLPFRRWRVPTPIT